jgi:hypothetical protein
VRLEGFGKLKKSTSSGLEPATFELVAYYLNQLSYRVPQRIGNATEFYDDSTEYEISTGGIFHHCKKIINCSLKPLLQAMR